jgi:hypothetical protein
VAWAVKTAEAMAKQPVMLEFRANRNALGSPLLRSVSMWRSMENWAKFNVSAWHSIEAELRGFATNVKVEVWGPSPVLSEPVRPAKQAESEVSSEKRSSAWRKQDAICAFPAQTTRTLCP